jgi:uncharacterized membrane protein YhhN
MRRGVLTAYAVVAVANVLGQVTGAEAVDLVTKPLLVPLLLALLRAAGRPTTRVGRATAVGLVCCWLGDLVLMGGDSWFLVGLLGFLAGQVAYCAAFATAWPRNPIRERRSLAAPYVAWWVLLLVVLGPDLGGLVAPVAVYGAVLCSMAALALGVHRLTAIGAVSFVASDSLLAATSLSDRFAFGGDDALVMTTYVVGQLLITLGVLAASRPHPGSAPGRPVATTSASATSAGRGTPGRAGR